MTVYFENETEREFPFDPEEQAKKVISFVCDHENCPYETEVSVTIVEKKPFVRSMRNTARLTV